MRLCSSKNSDGNKTGNGIVSIEKELCSSKNSDGNKTYTSQHFQEG